MLMGGWGERIKQEGDDGEGKVSFSPFPLLPCTISLFHCVCLFLGPLWKKEPHSSVARPLYW